MSTVAEAEHTESAADGATIRRPRWHFTPARNWMNDPNGLVRHDGRWHLYFQHNPNGIDHGTVGWGHASSTDLLTWTEHEVALEADDDGQVFSGSVVLDAEDTSGLGSAGHPPLVAIWTQAAETEQSQALASSTDGGYRWRKHPGNPVLRRGSADFRDPKVFRYEGADGPCWIMVAVEAQDRQVLVHRSTDLRSWTLVSTYGPAGPVGGVWECPDLFPLTVDGDPDRVVWVLLISLNPGGVAGGSGTHVVLGQFDGERFVPEEPLPAETRLSDGSWRQQTTEELATYRWLDHGPDAYAGVTFSGTEGPDRILVAWMGNWDYAKELPTRPWRGAMTAARVLGLTERGGRLELVQRIVGPDGAAETVLRRASDAASEHDLPGVVRVEVAITLRAAEGTVRLDVDDADGRRRLGLRYDAAGASLRLDRPAADGLPAAFERHVAATVRPDGDRVALTLWFDESSVEVSSGGGTGSMTALLAGSATDGRRRLLVDPGPHAVAVTASVGPDDTAPVEHPAAGSTAD
ncbi:glycoside hydrolase family 32 protein [Curtobacterium sp. RHCJP20]|uniref:Glycoside hydrolase family 32 protein n=1 Tax=Curtobacterium subtropicum TaxID=3055138 RepID=A0ABT7TCI6_9MICO|nr:glycoside hydrolase family 32 protein [Curtobacterium subtropicum]MDM7887290.1 glycoside hydrolase family 32 protein [Curtobacterium subtropicum]